MMEVSKQSFTVEFDGMTSVVIQTEKLAGIVNVYDGDFSQVFPRITTTDSAVTINFFTLEITGDQSRPLMTLLYPPGQYKVVLIF